ncbi:MAG TPA: hypothetical protein VN429_11455 [Methanospirillum sp.]|uniref:hypothetical protein n=1 Tax=Methanospirillum sp. TaxID=45200 RepID=UPI002C25B80A|nr:hypothetical protein [Methanospirillum sp.]HWQ65025.1 hypothetical protein [Methanospirillum sp.]
MTKTLNLDALYPERKVLTLCGKTFDVTQMPLSIFLMIQKQARNGGITLQWYQEPLTSWLQSVDPSVTPEWVQKATDDTMVMRTIEKDLFDSVLTDPLPDWISDQTPVVKA